MHQLGTHDQAVPAPKASGEYCSVSSDHGQMLSFYKAKPGTTERANETPTWVIMVPHRGDPYLAWWTPQFPYWERGDTSDGPSDPAFQYFEVSAVWENGWTPLTDVFTDYPAGRRGSWQAVVHHQVERSAGFTEVLIVP